MTAISISIQMALMMLGGFILRRTNRVGDSAAAPLTRLLIDLVIPCTIVNSMCSFPFSTAALQNSLILIGVGALYYLVVYVLAVLLSRSKSGGPYAKPRRFAMVTPNYAAMGTPIAEAFYGAEGVLYNTMMGLPLRITLYVSLPFLFGGVANAPKRGFREKLRGALSALSIPPVYATLFGIVLFLAQWRPPELIMSALGAVSKMCLPLGVILCGVVLGGIPKGVKFSLSVLWITLFRNLLAPAIMLGLSLLMHLPPLVAKTAVTMASLPVAIAYAAFCVSYDTDPQQASVTVLLSTVLSVVTVPMWHYILELVLP